MNLFGFFSFGLNEDQVQKAQPQKEIASQENPLKIKKFRHKKNSIHLFPVFLEEALRSHEALRTLKEIK